MKNYLAISMFRYLNGYLTIPMSYFPKSLPLYYMVIFGRVIISFVPMDKQPFLIRPFTLGIEKWIWP